jgi:integrase/recombinase XerD
LDGIKLHSLRHTFATRLIELGVDILTIARLLGHADIKTTMIYAKAELGALRSAVKKLDMLQLSGEKLVIEERK